MTDPKVTLRCSDCGGELLERTNKQNGSRFMGCANYPTCHHSEPIPAYLSLLRAGAEKLPGFDTEGL